MRKLLRMLCRNQDDICTFCGRGDGMHTVGCMGMYTVGCMG